MRAQTQWRTFLRESPAYPPDAFEGRGIVILAGGLTYMVPAWVNIHMLRRTGVSLTLGCKHVAPAPDATLASNAVTCFLLLYTWYHAVCSQTCARLR